MQVRRRFSFFFFFFFKAGIMLFHWSASRGFLSSFFWKLPVRSINMCFQFSVKFLGFSCSHHGQQMSHCYLSILLFCLCFNPSFLWPTLPFSHTTEWVFEWKQECTNCYRLLRFRLSAVHRAVVMMSYFSMTS